MQASDRVRTSDKALFIMWSSTLHGVSVLIPAGGLAIFCRFRPGTPFRPTRTRLPVNAYLNKRSVQLVDPAGPLAKLQTLPGAGLAFRARPPTWLTRIVNIRFARRLPSRTQ